MDPANSPALPRLTTVFQIAAVVLFLSLAGPLFGLQTKNEKAHDLLKQVVNELEGQGQTTELKKVFSAQMADRRIEDAVKTLNVMLADPSDDDSFFGLTQGLYYRGDNYLVAYPDIVRLIKHPALQVTNRQRNGRMDSLYSSMIHVLVQTEHMDMAVEYAKSFSGDPRTIKTTDESYNPIGYNLCRGWAKICMRYLDDKKAAEVIEIAESFVDPEVRRDMLTEFASQLKKVEDPEQRQQLLELYNEAVANNPAKRGEAERDEIDEAIKKADFETAGFLLDSYDDFHDFHVAGNAVALIEALYQAGETEQSTRWLKKVCNSGAVSTSYNSELSKALTRAGLNELACDFFGPLQKTKDLSSPMFAQFHQPLLKLALSSLKDSDVDQAIRFADAIQESCWKSATFLELYKAAHGKFDMRREEWYEKAIKVSAQMTGDKNRDWRLYIVLRERLPADRNLMDERLALIESPRIKAETLAWWMTRMIDDKSLPQPEIDEMIQQLAEWDPTSLDYVVTQFVESGDMANSLKAAKLFQHKDSMSAYQFDDLFKLIFPRSTNEEVLAIIDTQMPVHRGRIMYFALRHVPESRKKEFAAKLVQRLDQTHIDLSLTNELLKTYMQWGDNVSVKKILNIDLPDNQFVYDETEYNNWPTYAGQFATKNGGTATIKFAEQLTPPRIRAITYGSGIYQLLTETPTDKGIQEVLQLVKANPDPVLRGHGMLKIANRLLAQVDAVEKEKALKKDNAIEDNAAKEDK